MKTSPAGLGRKLLGSRWPLGDFHEGSLRDGSAPKDGWLSAMHVNRPAHGTKVPVLWRYPIL